MPSTPLAIHPRRVGDGQGSKEHGFLLPSLLSILTSAKIFMAENIPEENQKLICPSGLMYDDHLLRQYDWEIFQGLDCYFVHLEVINLLPMMKSTSAAIPWGSVLPFDFTFSSTSNFLAKIPVSPLLLIGCTPFQFPLAVSRITREINQVCDLKSYRYNLIKRAFLK